MPRLPINHANTQIYRFVCNDVNITNTYVGSTTNWSHRKGRHKSNCNNLNGNSHHLNVYQVIRANGGWVNWTMVLVENFPCNGRREAEQREQYWKEHYNDNMGMKRAFTTEEQKAEYYATHKEQFVEYTAKYRATHKDQIAEYRVTHKDQKAESDAEYRATHRDQINLKKRQARALKSSNYRFLPDSDIWQ